MSNIDLSIPVTRRWMEFAEDSTIHHRNEEAVDSDTHYGIGDIRLVYRYLIYNDVVGKGHRFFLGGGLLIPSKHSFSENPYQLSDSLKTHTHFALSDGNYKALLEVQYFRRTPALFLFGGTFNAAIPISVGDAGNWAGNEYNLAFYTFLHEQSVLKIGLFSFQLNGVYRTADIWENYENGNDGKIDLTEGGIVNAGIGFSREVGTSTLHLQIQKSVYNTVVPGGDNNATKAEMDAYNISLSLKSRLNLDF